MNRLQVLATEGKLGEADLSDATFRYDYCRAFRCFHKIIDKISVELYTEIFVRIKDSNISFFFFRCNLSFGYTQFKTPDMLL